MQTSLVHVNPLYKNDDEFDLARMPSSCAFSEEELTQIINSAGSELPPSSSGAQSPLAPTLPPQPSVPAPPSAISNCSCLPPSRSFTISFVPLDTPPFADGVMRNSRPIIDLTLLHRLESQRWSGLFLDRPCVLVPPPAPSPLSTPAGAHTDRQTHTYTHTLSHTQIITYIIS